jgi:hypothetical protein
MLDLVRMMVCFEGVAVFEGQCAEDDEEKEERR